MFLAKDSITLNLPDGGFILVNKPQDWTSFDVVNKIRGSLKRKFGKLKVGHAGTLDPMATGLLIIAFGRSTKRLEEFSGLDKDYDGTITLGIVTDTYDMEGEIIKQNDIQGISEEDIIEGLKTFKGRIEQVPPKYSALKMDGTPMYKLARKGRDFTPQPREVAVHRLDIVSIELPKIEFSLSCSKGTYVRSIAFDLGEKLGCGGTLSRLIRTSIGDHQLSDAWELNELIAFIENLEDENSQGS